MYPQSMLGVHLIVIAGGALLLATPLVTFMLRANRNERESIERRRAEWLASGGRPEDQPNFYAGSAGSSG